MMKGANDARHPLLVNPEDFRDAAYITGWEEAHKWSKPVIGLMMPDDYMMGWNDAKGDMASKREGSTP